MAALIMNALRVLIYIGFFVIVIGATIAGGNAGAGSPIGLIGGVILGFLGGILYAVLVTGIFILLFDIRDRLVSIDEKTRRPRPVEGTLEALEQNAP